MAMQIRRSYVKAIAAFLVTIVIVPPLGQFFISLAEERGWYQNPGAKMGAVIVFVAAIASSPLFHWIGGAIIGFAVGIWLDIILKRRDELLTQAHGENVDISGSYKETRLRLRADPSGSRTLLQEKEVNIDHWQQTIVSIGSDNKNLLHADTISMTFRQDTDYSRPIIETFGHKVGGYNFYTLGKKGAVFQFFGGVQAPMLEIWFPPPDHYTKLK